MSDKPARAKSKKPTRARIEGLFSGFEAPPEKPGAAEAGLAPAGGETGHPASEPVEPAPFPAAAEWKPERLPERPAAQDAAPDTPPEPVFQPAPGPAPLPQPPLPPAAAIDDQPAGSPAVAPAPASVFPAADLPAARLPAAGLPVEARGSAVVRTAAEAEAALPAVSPLTSLPVESLKSGKPLTGNAVELRANGNQAPAVLAYGRPLPVSGMQAAPQAPALLLEVLDEDSEREWSEDELLLVEQVTDQLTLALENARLFEEARQRNEELTTLNQIAGAVSTMMELDQVLPVVLERMLEAIEYESGLVSLVDPLTDRLYLTVHQALPEKMVSNLMTSGMDGTVCDLVYRDGRTMYIPDLTNPDPEFYRRFPDPEVLAPALQRPMNMGFTGYVGVPLISKGVRLGTVCAFSPRHQTISPSRIGLLEAVGQQVGVVIENVRLFEQTQRTRDALQESERYQKGVAQAVAALTERGIAALSEVLELLGHAAEVQRVHYLETQVDQNGPYWRVISEWRAPGTGSQLSNPMLRRLGVPPGSPLAEELSERGYASVNAGQMGAPSEMTDLLRAFTAQSVLLFGVPGRHELPGSVVFEQTDLARVWAEDEIAALQTAAAALANTIAREDLFTQVQANLAETEAQYQASSRLNSATSYDDILTVLRQHTILGHLNAAGVVLNLFDRPWRRSQRAEWLAPIAGWQSNAEAGRRGGELMDIDPAGTEHHPLADWKTADLLLDAERPTMVLDVASDPRLDDTVRDLYVKPFGGRSLLFAPLNVSGRWIGHIVGVYHRATGFPEQELRRLTSLAGQAAVAIEGLRLVEETRRRNEELDTLNKIAGTLSTMMDLEQVLPEVLQRTLNIIEYDSGLISLVDAATDRLYLAVHQTLPEKMVSNLMTNGMDRTVCDIVFRDGRTLYLPDLTSPDPEITGRYPDPEMLAQATQKSMNMGFNGYIGVAISSKGVRLGTVCAFHPSTKTIPPARIELLEAIGQQVGVVIENVRLFQGTQVALNETESLYQASAELNAAHAYDDILDTLRKHTVLGRAATLLIDLYDHPWLPNDVPEGTLEIARWERSRAEVPTGDEGSRRRLLPTAPAAQRLLQTNSVSVVDNLTELFKRSDPRLVDGTAPDGQPATGLAHLYPELRPARIAVLIPLLAGGQRIGHTLAIYPETIQVSEDDVRRLTALGGQAAVALQTLRLLAESQRRARQLQTAAEIARDTSSTLALDALLGRTANLVHERFGYDLVTIFLVDEVSVEAVVAEATGQGAEKRRKEYRLAVGGQTVVGQVTGTGRPLVLNDLRQATGTEGTSDTFDDVYPAPEAGGGRNGAELCIPLKIADRVIGALDVQSSRTNAFSEDDLSVMQTLADQLAVAVDNAQAYELTRKAMEEIREADRLKTQFLANMSHELRTPLNSIIGFSRVILKGIDGPINDQQSQDLTAIYNSGQHLLGLINDVLDLSRIEAGKMDLAFEENVNLGEIVKSVMSTTIGLVKDKPIELRQRIAPELPTVTIDPMKVRQVLINLLSNASKFTEEGSITVEAEPRRGENGREEVIVRVVDSGPGIAQVDQSKLFQPFSQVDGSLTRKTGGSGLGLSICQHLIRMHGGQIGLESEVGKGTTFYFTLPVRHTDSREEEENPAAGSTDPGPAAEESPAAMTADPGPAAEESPAAMTADPGPAAEESRVAGIADPGPAHPPSTMAATEEHHAAGSADPSPTGIPVAVTGDPGSAVVDFSGMTQEPPQAQSALLPALVLAVDRDPQVTEMYRRYLAAYNVTVISLSELDQIATVARSIQPVAITLDVAMQGRVGGGAPGRDPAPVREDDPFFIDGWQVLKSLKKDPETSQIPVIVCTLAHEPQRAYDLGANDYLLKPILEDDLVQALQKLRKTE